MRRGILGGTFDPPHIAHLMAGETAYRQLALDIVTFLPAGAPWQKADRDVSDALHRWEMTRAAVAGVDYFVADDREVRRDGWTYTIDTLESFDGDDELVLILGADAAARLPSWRRWRDVVDRAEIAVVPRPGIDRSAVEDAVPRLIWIEAPEVAVSGTLLRTLAADGRSIRFLVREGVWAYINEHRVYV